MWRTPGNMIPRDWQLLRLVVAIPFLAPVFICWGIWRLQLFILFPLAWVAAWICGIDELPTLRDWIQPNGKRRNVP